MYRLDKRTGDVRSVTDLGFCPTLQFNNPIYDRKHDQIYASRLNGTVFSLRRTDGAIQWSQSFPDFLICSSLTYHGGIVYVPLWNSSGTGAVAALNAVNGDILWYQDGFFGEDGWSAMAVCDRYLYRSSHGTTPSRIIVQDRFTGELVWTAETDGLGTCTNPILSDGIVVFGTRSQMVALKVGEGLPVNSSWHGVTATGANPGAILWEESDPDPDEDGDGLPDIWEVATFGNLFQQATDDFDGGGLVNRAEHDMGLDATLAEPRDAAAFVGGTARFSVNKLRSTLLRFQWFRNGVAVPGETNAAVEIGPLTMEDNSSRWSIRLLSLHGVFESRAAVLNVSTAIDWTGSITSVDLANGRVNGMSSSGTPVSAVDLEFSTDLKDWKTVSQLADPGSSFSFPPVGGNLAPWILSGASDSTRPLVSLRQRRLANP